MRTPNAEVPAKALIRWIRRHLRDDHEGIETAVVVEELELHHPELSSDNDLLQRRKLACELISAARLEEFGYVEIKRNEGIAVPVRSSAGRCICTRGCGTHCLNRSRFIEFSREICSFYGGCSNRIWCAAVTSPVKLKIQDAGGKGRGVFAVERIKSGTLVRENVGDVIDADDKKNRVDRGDGAYIMEFCSNLYVDAVTRGNCSRFMNRACKPNCQAQEWTVNGVSRIGIVLVRTIQPGDEVTINYGDKFGIPVCLCLACTSSKVRCAS
jgi:hypothetical protein